MILKLQTDMSGTQLLMYNEDRSVQHEESCPESIASLLGPMGKCYCEATVTKNGEIEILRLLPRQYTENW